MNFMLRFLTTSICIILFVNNNLVFAQYDEEYNTIQSESQNINNQEKSQKAYTNTDKYDDDESKGKWDWRNFRVGGNLGLSFGSYTYVEISPTFGYWVIPNKLQVGISTKFIYQSIREYNSIDRYKSFLYGGGFFSDYIIWNGIFARMQFEAVNKEAFFKPGRITIPHLLLGAGYIQPAGEFGNFYIAALFNVLDSDESIYRGTFGDFPLILQMGFGIGFPGRKGKRQ